MHNLSQISPYVKWVGGKRQMIDELISLVPKHYNNYIEPFFGGGALFFYLQPKDAIINDLNSEITNSMYVIKTKYDSLISLLDEFTSKHNETFYYEIRNENSNDKLIKAARFIYLNKAGFNGMYRVNKNNQFNVPFGKKEKINLYNVDNLSKINKLLNNNNIKIFNKSYKDILENVQPNDFVFLDPPYDTDKNEFTSYTNLGFNRKNQEELACLLDHLSAKGIRWILTNNATDFIIKRYKKYNQKIIKTNRSINCDATKRKKSANEIIIWNYEQ